MKKWPPGRFAAMLILTVCWLPSACSHFTAGNTTADYPEAMQFQQIYQGKLMAAAHWKLIAENEAERLAARFTPQSTFNLAGDDPIHPTPNDSRFGVAYQQMLTSGLIDSGMRVFDSGADFQLSYHLSVIEHQPRSQIDTPRGFFTGVVASAFILAAVVDQAANPGVVLLPLAAAADIYRYSNSDTKTPDTEIVLTTAVRRDTEIVYSNSSIYYMRAVDRDLYDACDSPGCRDVGLPESRGDGSTRFKVADPAGLP